MRTSYRTLLVALVAAVTALALAGCTSTPSSISGAAIKKKVSAKLAENTKSSSLTCQKIAYKKGATSSCDQKLTTPDGVAGEFSVAIKMTKAGSDGKYEISYKRVLPAKEFHVLGDAVAKDLKEQWDQSQPTPATQVTCPDVPGKVGAKVTCEVVAGDTVKATTTVTEADPSTLAIKYDFARA